MCLTSKLFNYEAVSNIKSHSQTQCVCSRPYNVGNTPTINLFSYSFRKAIMSVFGNSKILFVVQIGLGLGNVNLINGNVPTT